MSELSAWHGRLKEHFAKLQTARHEVGGSWPIFALEHSLGQSDLVNLAAALKSHIADGAPSQDHALAWVVYAAEIGYRYSGDEYWQTFERETPGWTVHGDRYWIRDCFRLFQANYGGAKPSGPWAKHFSIICWPITHAILPRDLQRQLARILYELRHSFSAELFESPRTLGEFIAARSWRATSRFQNFAQEPDFAGQIAAALLLKGQFGAAGLIDSATLKRIADDLDRERVVREWLRSAGRFAEERARIRGLGLGHGPTIVRPAEARAAAAALGIEPRLILRPLDTTATSWQVLLEIPDLSHLVVRFPETREVLTGARCVVAGAAGRPLARGRCLEPAQRVTLARWPRPDEVLIQFEQTDAQLDYLLRTECLLRPGPWLFRIASDGLAYELRSLRVRAGERYIIVSTNVLIAGSNHVLPIGLRCEGVQAALLDVPSALTAEWEKTLRNLGLGQAKTIEVSPAGLSAFVWDGEGHAEWLASERPCLAVRSDHPIETLLISMASRPDLSLEISPIAPGEPVFVELPQLPVGLHTVRVSARTAPGLETQPLGDLEVVMRIREARPWSPGMSTHGPLVVQMDPVAPTLEELWEGRADIALRGPTGRQVRCSVSLRNSDSGVTIVTKRLPSIPLPVTPDNWRRHFEKHFQQAREIPSAYDNARVCEIHFSAEELGAFTIYSEREFTPLRWTVRREAQGYIARLLDDSGDNSPPSIERFAFETPSVAETLAPGRDFTVPSQGGLYVGWRGEFTAAVIIPPSVRGFGDLRCVPRIDERERSTDSILRVLGVARLWGTARLSGDLFAAMRQRDVVQAFTREIFRILGGDKWTEAEEANTRGVDNLTNLKRAVVRRTEDVRLIRYLAPDAESFARAGLQERIEHLAAVSKRFHLLPSDSRQEAKYRMTGAWSRAPQSDSDAYWISEFALRLASDPASLETWAGKKQLALGVADLFISRVLARAARFLVLMVDHHLESGTVPRQQYAGWDWA